MPKTKAVSKWEREQDVFNDPEQASLAEYIEKEESKRQKKKKKLKQIQKTMKKTKMNGRKKTKTSGN